MVLPNIEGLDDTAAALSVRSECRSAVKGQKKKEKKRKEAAWSRGRVQRGKTKFSQMFNDDNWGNVKTMLETQ